MKECCMIALMSEIEVIIDHMMRFDYNRGCMGGSVPGYIRRAVAYMMLGGRPPHGVCECVAAEGFQCRWHIPHIEYMRGFAASILSIELYLMDRGGEIEITPCGILATCRLILGDEQDPYHISLREWLEESTSNSIMKFREY